MRAVRSYPFAWMPRWTRAEAALARSVLRRVLPARPPPAAREVLDARWHALLGGRFEAWPLAPYVTTADAVRARYEGDALAPVMRHATLGVIAVLVDAPFALTLAARTLGADDDAARHAGAARDFTPAYEGALALLAAQAAVLACAPSPAPIVRAVTDRVADALAALGSSELLAWPWRCTVGLDAGEACLLLDPRAQLREAARDALHAVRDASQSAVRVELVVARATLPAATVGALARGDVLVLESGVALDASGDGIAGSAVLALGAVDLPVSLAGDEVRVAGAARARRFDVDHDAESGSPPAGGAAVRTELLGALPLEVEVVVARGQFAVGEVGAWRVGEVVALPTRVGEAVVVRAGGRAVARGELCDVEGEVGVRITELV